MGKQATAGKNSLTIIGIIILIPIITAANNQVEQITNKDLYYQDLNINQHLVRTITVNPDKYRIINATASSTQQNTASIETLAATHNAVAGINGGFFRKTTGNSFVPAGLLKVDGIWHGIAYRSRAAIGWHSNNQQTLVDRLTTKSFVKLGEKRLAVNYFNPTNPNNNQLNQKIIIYSNIYPDFKDLDLNINLNQNRQNFLIKSNNVATYIFNVNKNHPEITKLPLATINSAAVEVDIYPQLAPNTKANWEQMQFITSGAPVLIKDHQPITDYAAETLSANFIENPYPRTAVCILDNGFWKLAITQSISIPGLTTIMEQLSCKDAINLDGGGSSNLYISEAIAQQNLLSLANPVTDAILVLTNNQDNLNYK